MERSVGERMVRRSLEAPVLTGEMREKLWYKLPIPEGKSGDGSEYHVFLKKADPEKICVFFSGGGVAWNAYTAARPITGGRVLAGDPNFYTHNLRPVTQIANINVGITESGKKRNPFDDWSFLIITYSTGDIHVGNGELPYTDEEGQQQTLYFNGHNNFRAAMDRFHELFPKAGKLLIAGCSAGAFAVPALAGEILEDYYPDCRDITLLSDSGQLECGEWQRIVRDVWQAKEALWRPVDHENLTLCWYRALYRKYGSRFRYLYASSTRDFLLSAYNNDMQNKSFSTDPKVQRQFNRRLKEMIISLHELNPDFGFFIHGIKNPVVAWGGTIHTIVREPYFYRRLKCGVSMADWLSDAVEGSVRNIGVRL